MLKKFLSDLKILEAKINKNIYPNAVAKFKDFLNKNDCDVLLHGDLHHDNILSQGKSFKVIDPHGYIGPKAFDVGAMMRNPCDAFLKSCNLKETIEVRVSILTD